MQRRDVVLVPGVRLEAAREHRLQHRGVAALGGPMEHQVVLGTQLLAQVGLGREHRIGGRAIGARASRDEAIERRELVVRAVREQPRGDVGVAVQLRQRVRRAAVGPPPRHIRAVLDEPLDHRHIPSSRRDVQRRLTVWPQARFGSAPCSSSQRGPAGLSAHCIMYTSGGTPPGMPFTLTP